MATRNEQRGECVRPSTTKAIRLPDEFRRLGDAFDELGPGLSIVHSQGVSTWIVVNSAREQLHFYTCIADFNPVPVQVGGSTTTPSRLSIHENKVANYVRDVAAALPDSEIRLETRGRSYWLTRFCAITPDQMQAAAADLAKFMAIAVPLTVTVRDKLGAPQMLAVRRESI